MHLRHLLVAPLLVASVACHSDDVTVNPRPALGGVRFINAVPNGPAVDIRYIDQVEWSGSSVNGSNIGLAYLAGTIHWATEAKARRIRVFPSDSVAANASTVLHDTTITIEANKNVTLLLVGSRAAGGRVSFIKIDDTAPTLTDQQVAVRMVNAGGTGATTVPASGYLTSTTTSPLPANSTWENIGAFGVGSYVVRDTGAFAVRTSSVGGATIFASAAAPAGAPAVKDAAGRVVIGATAGASGAGTALSAYLFPAASGTACPTAGCTGALANPALIWFVDKVPPPAKL